jgi:hypothetical protein
MSIEVILVPEGDTPPLGSEPIVGLPVDSGNHLTEEDEEEDEDNNGDEDDDERDAEIAELERKHETSPHISRSKLYSFIITNRS